eukprot:CAMPEP_0196723236 /NCGR_PEP_ID=MMETSP1091-20130531/5375_1 /TAXON_ID=302021 /ORGANISM="Rhodomonas sp., Strain CCMP768" /LENGTH=183 /DNA_ID=CAMNT_0042065087 /DNA_START=92 /DNA_END=643 /DNA_ORIENTATION=+
MSVQSSGTTFQGNGFRHGGSSYYDDTATTNQSTVDDVGLTAQPQTTRKLAGRMCFGVSLPMTGHTAYVFDICTSDGEQWKLTRRYSDFLELDEKLRQMFGKPTRPFPPLPKKVLLGNQSEKVIEERQRMLTAYLQAVLDNKILSSTIEVKRFIEMQGQEEDETPSVFRTNLPLSRGMLQGDRP